MTSRTYQIELAGVLHDDTRAALKSELDGAFKFSEPAGTVITGTTADQAALLGVFDRLHALGLHSPKCPTCVRSYLASASRSVASGSS